MSNKVAKLIIGDITLDLPIQAGTLGSEVIDISQLRKQGYFTYDPGFVSTASCESNITFIDGDEGRLLYRGYPIEQLAEKSDYLEVCYLLLKGELPNSQEQAEFVKTINNHTMLHEQITSLLEGFRRDSHPMAIMVGVVGALAAFYHDVLDIHNPTHRQIAAYRLIAKMPTIAAMCYKYSIGQPLVFPENHRGYSENFLRMMFAVPSEPWQNNAVLSKAMDRIFILHADHEQNASTSTVRLAGSSGANPFACISSGITALWGPAHGGANEAVLNMLHQIGDISQVNTYLKKARDRDDPFRLMGFGHRVYKNYDPRAKIMRETCHEVLDVIGARDNPLFKLALELERIALEDDYFVKKQLYPNVDFYSGITLSALGIPTSMFTAIFALARTVGWISHWNEMVSTKDFKIGRPRQLYNGPVQRDYIAIDER